MSFWANIKIKNFVSGRRSEVRIALMRDDVDEAIRILNELDSDILLQNPDVHFRLKQQQLLQIIRDGQVDAAITFAREKLGPFVQQDQSLLPLLEDTMGLLAFSDLTKPGAQAQLEKLAPQKGETSSRVDSAILRLQKILSFSRFSTFWIENETDS